MVLEGLHWKCKIYYEVDWTAHAEMFIAVFKIEYIRVDGACPGKRESAVQWG